MKKTLISLSIIMLCSGSVFAEKLASWSAAGVSGGFVANPLWKSSATAAGVMKNETYVSLDASKANKLYSPHANVLGYSFQNDPSLNPDKYIQIFITPSTGKALTLTKFSFNVWSAVAGAKNVAVRSSLDDFNSDLMTGTLNEGKNNPFTVELTGFSDLTANVQFRIYLWGATGKQIAYLMDWSRPAVIVEGTVN